MQTPVGETLVLEMEETHPFNVLIWSALPEARSSGRTARPTPLTPFIPYSHNRRSTED